MSLHTPASGGIPSRNVLLAFILFVLVSGGASVAIRITYAELAPFWAATARFGLGAAIFWILAYVNKLKVPRGRALLGAVIFGTLTVGFAFILIAWGLVETPASLYQILMATVPLLTLFLSALHGIEKIRLRGLTGSLLAIVGITVAVGGTTGANLSWIRLLGILLAAACMAEGGVVIKKFPPNPPLMTNALGMTVGTVILGSASLISGETWSIPTQSGTWIAFIYLVLVVTVVAFITYMYVLRNWTASNTSYGFVLIPLVTVVVASTIAGEVVTLNFLLGGVLVISGVLVGALIPEKANPAPVEECKDRSGQVLPRCS